MTNDQKFQLLMMLLSKGINEPEHIVKIIGAMEKTLFTTPPANLSAEGEEAFQCGEQSNAACVAHDSDTKTIPAFDMESFGRYLKEHIELPPAMQLAYEKGVLIARERFTQALNDLCHKHGLFLANIEGKDGLAILPIELHMKSAGYINQGDSGQIDFDWY